MTITIDNARQYSGLPMPTSGTISGCVSGPMSGRLRSTVVATGAPVAGSAPAAGQKFALVPDAFTVPSTWSPPI